MRSQRLHKSSGSYMTYRTCHTDFIKRALTLTLLVTGLGLHAALRSKIPDLLTTQQLIVVLTNDWTANSARIQRFDRSKISDHNWRAAGSTFAAVLGTNGLGWGIGLHGTGAPGDPVKQEGDRRSPAGIFRLAQAFGRFKAGHPPFSHWPYEQVVATTLAIDDPKSQYYNRIVDLRTVLHPDWQHAEWMQQVGGEYRCGVMVKHNWDQIPGRGSCIFLHVWTGPNSSTAGCTAMAETDLMELLRWLDQSKHPLLVQLPVATYEQLRPDWALPSPH
jgi:L,D-peptidoglycan transpeptidase YkuD (ErfK/YbiS/YcfS/YnhG family)